ncbi:MAG: hypothetical protein N2036_12090 [Bryobacteraceae bacterium]|nr:hypothetical protein [Bryobacteraceae bacterium]MCX7604807.1 hypothetical protein [Bryobacteraceae bacterium]
MSGGNQNLERELDRLLAAYRDACEAPEPSADFMPTLWARIEAAEQGWSERLWKWANGLAAAAAVASVLLVALQMAARPAPDYYSSTYVESLLAQTDAELAPVELAGVPSMDPGPAERPER